MSEALAYRSPKPSRSETLVNRLLWIVIVLLALFLAGELAFHFLISPRLLIRKVVISADLGLSREEILRVAGLEENEYYFGLDADAVAEHLRALPQVREAAVEKVFPDTLRITLSGRSALAMALYESPSGHTVPLAVDPEGVVFQIGPEVSEWDLPVLGGLKFRDLRAGMELPEVLRPLLRDLENLRSAHPDLYALISEVRYVPKPAGGYELVLHLIPYRVRVRVGAGLKPEVLKNALLVLDLLARENLVDRILELDARTGEMVYRLKEG